MQGQSTAGDLQKREYAPLGAQQSGSYNQPDIEKTERCAGLGSGINFLLNRNPNAFN